MLLFVDGGGDVFGGGEDVVGGGGDVVGGGGEVVGGGGEVVGGGGDVVGRGGDVVDGGGDVVKTLLKNIFFVNKSCPKVYIYFHKSETWLALSFVRSGNP